MVGNLRYSDVLPRINLWFSRTQRCVLLSSREAEYVALVECVKEVVFVHQILDFLRPHVDGKATVVYEDNEGAFQLATNALGLTRTKDIDVEYYFSGI